VQPPEALQPAEPAVAAEPQESEESVEEKPRKWKTPFKRTAALDGQLRTFKVLLRLNTTFTAPASNRTR